MSNVATITTEDLTRAEIVVLAGGEVTETEIAHVLNLCAKVGVSPLVVIVDHASNLRFVSDEELASSALLIVARRSWERWPDRLDVLGAAIAKRCTALNAAPPMLVTADRPDDDIVLSVTNADQARELVAFLTERFAL